MPRLGVGQADRTYAIAITNQRHGRKGAESARARGSPNRFGHVRRLSIRTNNVAPLLHRSGGGADFGIKGKRIELGEFFSDSLIHVRTGCRAQLNEVALAHGDSRTARVE